MIGNSHVRFLGEGKEATLEPYPTVSQIAGLQTFLVTAVSIDVPWLELPDTVSLTVPSTPTGANRTSIRIANALNLGSNHPLFKASATELPIEAK